ncbi:MAG TPA: membrane protein insertase YidC [Bryobacteraceae bacterium]|nr:membrane protein insertase YidC [Bryobacteraceae bacterium]
MPDLLSNKGPGGKGEMSMETRLLLAFVLVMLLLLVTPYFMSSPGPTGAQNITPKKAAELAKAPPAPATPEPAKSEPSESGAARAATLPIARADQEQTFIVDTRLYHIVFSNRGGVARSWILKQYKDLNGKPLELVNTVALSRVPAPFSYDFNNRKPDIDLNAVLFQAKQTEDKLGLDFEFSDGAFSAHKSFRFLNDSYLVRIASEVTRVNEPLAHVLMWRGGFGDPTVRNAPSVERAVYYDSSQGRLLTKVAKDAKGGPVSVFGPYSFAGIEDPYFTAVFLPSGTGNLELRTYDDSVPTPADPNKPEDLVGVGVGGAGLNQFSVFVGPKDTDILRKVDPKLENLIDWGRWFGFIAKPLFLVLNWVDDHVTRNYGWAIILVTIGINIVLFPLRYSSMRSAKKMQSLQPQIQAINAKYKNLSLRDPRQAEKNAEMMELYKKHGVNPLGGCVPMLIQLPFFIAFYTVLTVAIELRGAPWLWVNDLSRPETLPIRVLPILLIVTQFLTQKMTPASPGVDPAQQKMMMIMPLALGFMFYYASAGLVLYWLTGNLVGIGQQLIMNRVTPPAPAVEVKPAPKKKTLRT